jgi:hypothetical protein
MLETKLQKQEFIKAAAVLRWQQEFLLQILLPQHASLHFQ